MNKSAVVSSLAATLLVLSGCGGSLESTPSLPQNASSSSSPATSSASATSAAPATSEAVSSAPESVAPASNEAHSSSAPATTVAAEATQAPQMSTSASSDPAKVALQAGIAGFVPEDQRANWIAADGTSSFNADKDLSYIQVRTNGGGNAGNYALMLFHKGQYIGNSMSSTYGLPAGVERGADDALIVNYAWPKDGESSANASGKTVSVLSWDSASNSFVNTGNIPTQHYETVADARKDVSGIYAGAAQGVPSDAKRLGDSGAIKSPSGKIVCTVDGRTIHCANDAFSADNTYGGGKSAVFMNADSDQAEIMIPTTPEGFDMKGTLVYGTQVVLGDYIFAMDQSGLTVWSSTTGKGFFLNRDTYHTFG